MIKNDKVKNEIIANDTLLKLRDNGYSFEKIIRILDVAISKAKILNKGGKK